MPKQRSAPPRFTVVPFTPERMREIGRTFLGAFNARLDRAENIFDAPAKPLSPAYAKWKSRKRPPAIRNLRVSGITRGTIGVLSAGDNRALIGSPDRRANVILAINKRTAFQWGISPRDRQQVEQRIMAMRPVRTESGK